MKASQASGVERHTTLLKAAARVSHNIASILDLNLLLSRTSDIICEEFDLYYAGVFLVDETGEWAVLKAGYGAAGYTMMAEGHQLSIGGNSMVGVAIAERRARIATNVGKEAAFFKNPHLPNTRSEMALPLIAGDDVIGALTVQSEKEAAFQEEDIAALQTMADQLAVAIQNANLHRKNQELLRQVERRARLFHAANAVGREVTRIMELDKLLPKMVNTIVEEYGFYYAGIFLMDETGEWAVLRAGYGEAGRIMVRQGHKLQVGGNSMIGTCIRLNEARIAPDVGEERVFFKNPHLPHTRSEMALPLSFGTRVLGAVTIQSKEDHAFSQDDITTLQTMADHLAVAVQNAYALEELKAAHAQILRTKVYEALTAASTEAIHWIGNKALPITLTVERVNEELADGAPNVESLKEDLGMISESARQIVQVKEQLIGQAREQMPRPAMLVDIIQAAMHERNIPEEKIRLEIDPEASLVLADTTQLVRAFGNLLQNAVEADSKQISILVQPAVEKNTVEIVIQDDGKGIAAEDIDNIWSPFFTTKGGAHHGLGLPATLHIITQMNGRIMLESEVGTGTRILIYLPASRAVIPVEKSLSPQPESILLIDDNDTWAKFFIESLGKVVTLSSKFDPNIKPELILLDEHLEAAPFEAVLDEIQKAGLAPKTIVITAGFDVDRMTRTLHKGVRDVSLKPYTAEEIDTLWK
jgi:GAF domain-containing protein/anti-sigma regulatory factor (Ser/Thr protein kinase)